MFGISEPDNKPTLPLLPVKQFQINYTFVWYQDDRFYAILDDQFGEYLGFHGLALFESNDGYDWQVSEHNLVSKTELEWENGDVSQLQHLERPQLWFNDKGVPEMLFCALKLKSTNIENIDTLLTLNVHIPLDKMIERLQLCSSGHDLINIEIMKNRCFLLLLSMLLLGSCSHEKQRKEGGGSKPVRPNIIYVLADDLGIGDVGCFNPDSKIRTPHLDQLAADGMKFTDAHSSSAVCTPTRYGILTGRYNWRTTLKKSVLNGYSAALIKEDRETVASMLKESGYYTAFIGKWHLGWDWGRDSLNNVDFSKEVHKTPNDNGFDYAYGHCGSLDMSPYVYVENGYATAIPVDSTENKDEQAFWRKGLTSPDFIHDDVTPNFFRRSIKLIEERAARKEPFLLYLPLPSPHTPILPTEEWKGKSNLNPYGDFVMMVDAYMGSLIAAIEQAGIAENTLIIFTSDNGCSPKADFPVLAKKGHHPSYIFRGHKADIFEGGHRVPFIAKWPAVIESGSKSDKTICLTDLMATCASITNIDLADNSAEDSYDLLPLFKNPDSDEYLRKATVHHSINGSFAIRNGDWKLIMCPGSGGWSSPHPKKDDLSGLPPIQLYNIKNDPGETKNESDNSPEIVDELRSTLAGLINNGRSTAGEKQDNDHVKVWPQIKWMKNIN